MGYTLRKIFPYMEFIQYAAYPCKPLPPCLYPCPSVTVKIYLLYFFKVIVAVKVIIDFIPEPGIVLTFIHPTEIMRVNKPAPSACLICRLNALININQFGKYAVAFPAIICANLVGDLMVCEMVSAKFFMS